MVIGAPLVSCIVPVYNGETFLGEALDSILAQTYPLLEILVVDDGSTDGTPQVTACYGERVTYLRQQNAGPVAARNRGLGVARGEFVAFLDADDRWHPEKLERQLARFQALPELGYCVAHVQNFWVAELAEEAQRCQDHPRSKPVPGYVMGTLFAQRAIFEEVGLLDPGLIHGATADWFIRAAEHGVVAELLPDVLLYRRLHPRSLSRTNATESIDEHLAVLKARIDRRRQSQGRQAAE